MAMIDYDMMTREIRESLAEILTAAQMEKAMELIRGVVARYDVKLIDIPETSGEDFLLKAYIDAMSVEGRSPLTIRRYRYVIGGMLKRLGVPSAAVTAYHVRKYMADEKARGISDSTLKGLREVLNPYFGWLTREGLIQKNPMANIGPVKCQKKIKKAYSDTDVERLKMKCTTKKQKAILCFLLATGCRISEAVGLDRVRVNLEKAECLVLGKGNKERVAYLDQVAAMALREYLEERTDDCPALFLNRFGKRMGDNGVRAMLKKLGALAHVEKVHPHKFRRTRATNLIRRGMPIQEVAAILGHEKLDTTMQYVVLDQEETKNSYRKFA